MESWRSVSTSNSTSICLLICLYIYTYMHMSTILYLWLHLYGCICMSACAWDMWGHLCVHTYIHSSTSDVCMFIMTYQICIWSSNPPGVAPAVSCSLALWEVLNISLTYRYCLPSHRQFHSIGVCFVLCYYFSS